MDVFLHIKGSDYNRGDLANIPRRTFPDVSPDPKDVLNLYLHPSIAIDGTLDLSGWRQVRIRTYRLASGGAQIMHKTDPTIKAKPHIQRLVIDESPFLLENLAVKWLVTRGQITLDLLNDERAAVLIRLDGVEGERWTTDWPVPPNSLFDVQFDHVFFKPPGSVDTDPLEEDVQPDRKAYDARNSDFLGKQRSVNPRGGYKAPRGWSAPGAK